MMLVFSRKVPGLFRATSLVLLMLGALFGAQAVMVSGLVCAVLALVTLPPIPLPKSIAAAIRTRFGSGH